MQASPKIKIKLLNENKGVIETGLFIKMASNAYFGNADGSVEII
jgi:ribose 5-phosphate isomerase